MEIMYVEPMWEFKVSRTLLDAHFTDEQMTYDKPVAVKLKLERWIDERGPVEMISEYEIISQEQYSQQEIKEIDKWAESKAALNYALKECEDAKEYDYEPF